MTQLEQSINVSGRCLWNMFVTAHTLAIHPDVAYNDQIQYKASDLVIALSELVKEFELAEEKAGRPLPYDDSIFINPEYEWYVQEDED